MVKPLSSSPAPLSGRGIVITRPAAQAQHLAGLVQALGGNPILFPTLEILELEDQQPLFDAIDGLDKFDIVIFVSPNAIDKAMRALTQRRAIPDAILFAVVGESSARELQKHGVQDILVPKSGFDSEALLALPPMQDVKGKRILIFRGVGGRELLANVLRTRGAIVEYVECYRRAKPNLSAEILNEYWSRHTLHGFTVTSSEGLRNLYEMINGAAKQQLIRTPLFVTHPRIQSAAQQLKFDPIILTSPGDEGLLKGMLEWYSKNPH